ncbi:hypothetical protein AK812_SmicGene43005 [Symbiodinium microadriaticum]|uniref:Uncharacterized protein n=1 Tax=Symbiodinium microadriaticum TaxID=2951 RepID=A0A1Q9C251_SYMMI|nr:hypothetical protein AK812_SmicGene43005 [Symbiodinium microadriaticum]
MAVSFVQEETDQLRPNSLLHSLAKSIAWSLNKLVLDAVMALLEDPEFDLPHGEWTVPCFSHTAEIRALMSDWFAASAVVGFRSPSTCLEPLTRQKDELNDPARQGQEESGPQVNAPLRMIMLEAQEMAIKNQWAVRQGKSLYWQFQSWDPVTAKVIIHPKREPILMSTMEERIEEVSLRGEAADNFHGILMTLSECAVWRVMNIAFAPSAAPPFYAGVWQAWDPVAPYSQQDAIAAWEHDHLVRGECYEWLRGHDDAFIECVDASQDATSVDQAIEKLPKPNQYPTLLLILPKHSKFEAIDLFAVRTLLLMPLSLVSLAQLAIYEIDVVVPPKIDFMFIVAGDSESKRNEAWTCTTQGRPPVILNATTTIIIIIIIMMVVVVVVAVVIFNIAIVVVVVIIIIIIDGISQGNCNSDSQANRGRHDSSGRTFHEVRGTTLTLSTSHVQPEFLEGSTSLSAVPASTVTMPSTTLQTEESALSFTEHLQKLWSSYAWHRRKDETPRMLQASPGAYDRCHERERLAWFYLWGQIRTFGMHTQNFRSFLEGSGAKCWFVVIYTREEFTSRGKDGKWNKRDRPTASRFVAEGRTVTSYIANAAKELRLGSVSVNLAWAQSSLAHEPFCRTTRCDWDYTAGVTRFGHEVAKFHGIPQSENDIILVSRPDIVFSHAVNVTRIFEVMAWQKHILLPHEGSKVEGNDPSEMSDDISFGMMKPLVNTGSTSLSAVPASTVTMPSTTLQTEESALSFTEHLQKLWSSYAWHRRKDETPRMLQASPGAYDRCHERERLAWFYLWGQIRTFGMHTQNFRSFLEGSGAKCWFVVIYTREEFTSRGKDGKWNKRDRPTASRFVAEGRTVTSYIENAAKELRLGSVSVNLAWAQSSLAHEPFCRTTRCDWDYTAGVTRFGHEVAKFHGIPQSENDIILVSRPDIVFSHAVNVTRIFEVMAWQKHILLPHEGSKVEGNDPSEMLIIGPRLVWEGPCMVKADLPCGPVFWKDKMCGFFGTQYVHWSYSQGVMPFFYFGPIKLHLHRMSDDISFGMMKPLVNTVSHGNDRVLGTTDLTRQAQCALGSKGLEDLVFRCNTKLQRQVKFPEGPRCWSADFRFQPVSGLKRTEDGRVVQQLDGSQGYWLCTEHTDIDRNRSCTFTGLDVFDGVPAPGASKKMMKTKKKSGAKLP